jgi:iron complex transport system substrate-binding protein
LNPLKSLNISVNVLSIVSVWAIIMLNTSSVCAAIPPAQINTTKPTAPIQHRVIALAPHLAQLAYAAGAGHSLVAVSEYTPTAYVRNLPMVGNAFAVNWDLIAQLKPTLVLVWGSGTSVAVKARLKALNIATFESEPSTLAGIVQEAQTLAARLGEPANNPDLQALDTRFKQLNAYRIQTNQLNNATSNTHAIAAFHPIWPRPLMTINGQHVMSDALKYCGARNIFAKAQGLTPTVSLAQVLREQPKVIVISTSASEPNISKQWDSLINAFPKESGLQPTIITVNGERFHQPGPSMIEETLDLCKSMSAVKH